MSNIKFSQFTNYASAVSSQYIVGYDSIAGVNVRNTIASLGDYILTHADRAVFLQTPTGAAGERVLRWNDTDGTLDLGLKGGDVTLQIGQEQVARVVNKVGADLLESQYKVVRIISATGQRLTVDLAQANSSANSSTTLGVVTENIANNQEGFITILGSVREIDTTGTLQGEVWADGDVLYLSAATPGGLTKTKPTAPNIPIQVAIVEYAHAVHGKLYVNINTQYVLGDGTLNYIPKFSSATSISNSQIFDNGTSIGIGTAAPSASSLLELSSTTKGFLAPRMTTVQRGAIAAPATGLSVYNTTTNANNIYNGTAWLAQVTGSSTATYVAVFDAASNIKGYNYFTVIDGLYPTIAIGVNGVNSVGLRFKTNASSDYSYINPGTGLTFYGSNTYPYIDFYDKISGGTQVLRLWNSGGHVAQFAGRIGTSTTSTAGTNLGAFNIDRTFTELSSGPNHHGYVDKSVFRYGASAINSFYSELTVGTTNAGYTQDHVANFQSLLIKDGANTLNIQYDFVALGTLLNGGTLVNRYGFYLYDAKPAGGGSLTNQYGIYIPVLTGAATKNIGIYSGSVVTIGTTSPSASAMLQVDSTTKGFLPPRMTGLQAEAITSPAEGLLTYINNGNGVTITSTGWWGYNGSTWVKLN